MQKFLFSLLFLLGFLFYIKAPPITSEGVKNTKIMDSSLPIQITEPQTETIGFKKTLTPLG
jgi:hypothetical protein